MLRKLSCKTDQHRTKQQFNKGAQNVKPHAHMYINGETQRTLNNQYITRVPTLLLTKIQDFPGPPRIIFQDLVGAHTCLNIKKKNGCYLKYSECSPLQENSA